MDIHVRRVAKDRCRSESCDDHRIFSVETAREITVSFIPLTLPSPLAKGEEDAVELFLERSLASARPLHGGGPGFGCQFFCFFHQQAWYVLQNWIPQPHFWICADQGFSVQHKVTVTFWTDEIALRFFEIECHGIVLRKNILVQKPRNVRISANVRSE